MEMRAAGKPLAEVRKVIDGKYRGSRTPTPYPHG
jgi:hypothetical protein